ncbi:hypothetical protein SUGI_0448000 [Cryptomeria japonica]|nr:hypothetical protein SUGI_0448000 [Cryptomeria japonica]
MNRFLSDSRHNKKGTTNLEGTVILRRAALVDGVDSTTTAVDWLAELMQRKVIFQLVSSDKIDNETGHGKVSPQSELSWNTPSLTAFITDTTQKITFYWPPEYGTPGAILVKNNRAREFFLKRVCITVPAQGDINFLCNSWVYPSWIVKVAQASERNGIGFMITMFTMIWATRTRTRTLRGQLSADLLKTHFSDLKEVKQLCSKGLASPVDIALNFFKEIAASPIVKEILSTDDHAILKFPKPNIISRDEDAWRKNKELPISSNLNVQIYGPQESSITAQHLQPYLDGISVAQALKRNRLFILDYHDAYIPYVERINILPTSKVYAIRTIFFLLSDGTLKPIAIELCLPPTSKRPGERRVFTPDYGGEDEGWLWELAKAHARSNDAGYRQIVSHWLRTHAVVEPFIIATHRNLSKLHPLHKLLIPHFRNTMDINRAARQNLINAEGVIEQCFSPGRFVMEISAKAYVGWRFNEQGLPADLLKRGMAIPEPTNKANGLKLVVVDYPYAVDGLEIWDALKSWVSDYISLTKV